MYCDLWSQYIQLRKLFKEGNYSRAETICGYTVCILFCWQFFFSAKTPFLPPKARRHPLKYIDGVGLGTLVDLGSIFYTSVQGPYFLQLVSPWKITGQAREECPLGFTINAERQQFYWDWCTMVDMIFW